MPRPSGLLVSIDGPCGVGKSTTVRALAERVATAGVPVHVVHEPTSSAIGALASASVHTDTNGHALACLFAADRYQQLDTGIRPRLATGEIVIADRYIPAGLVMQRLDGVDLDFLYALNSYADPPDLAVVLTADPDVVAGRLRRRGIKNRYQQRADIAATEIRHYTDAANLLAANGINVLRLETVAYPPDVLASMIATRIDTLLRARNAGAEPIAAS